MTADDTITRAAEVLSRIAGTTGPTLLDRERARALDAAGLLASPEHDAQVLRGAGKTLAEMARVSTSERRRDGWNAAAQVLEDLAESCEAGESGA